MHPRDRLWGNRSVAHEPLELHNLGGTMKVEQYLAQVASETEFEAVVAALPGDTETIRVFPLSLPGNASGVLLRRNDIIEIVPTDKHTLQCGVPRNVARLKVRTGNVAELADVVFPIDWQALIESRVLPDGDRIHVAFEALEPNTLGGEVRLILGDDVSWWKQVEVYGQFDNGHRRIAHVEAADDHDAHDASFTNGGLRDGNIVLWKAKEFGVHKPKYVLSNVDERLTAQRAIFTWVDD
jgi:hypothetical protein